MRLNKQLFTSLVLLTALLAGCSSSSSVKERTVDTNTAGTNFEQVNDSGNAFEEENEANIDPFEPINRVIWDFNYDVLDRLFLKPVTQTYVAITPQFVRTGLVNASDNIEEPANTINNLLQGKVEDSLTSFARFAINSTVGVFGVFDVASEMELLQKRENFGHVLGVWGVGTGPYLMLPALGPSDIRSFTGELIDNFYWPGTVLKDPVVIGAAIVSIVETRALLLDQEEQLNRALDQYLFVRDAYFQRLAFEVSDGELEQKSEEELEEEQDDFSDFEDFLNGGA